MSDNGTMAARAIFQRARRREELLTAHECRLSELYAMQAMGQGETSKADALRAEVLTLWVDAHRPCLPFILGDANV